MELLSVLAELEAAGTAQNRKIYLRHGAHEPMFGVSFAILNALEKKIKRDHSLAVGLWATGNYDAMILACKVADPALWQPSDADAWVKAAYCYVLAGEIAGLTLKTSFAREKAEAWINADGEYVERAGWLVYSGLTENSALPDEYFLNGIQRIIRDIHKSKNRVRDAMNTALINIGLRPTLTSAALGAAAQVGLVQVDHGETGCKTPDAAAYIQKTLDYRARKAKK
jgi:3-methyladenine DNA glycosylase AlkD